MLADSELPVWSFKANWKEPILERLGWLTDVLPSSFGPEQRRALRLSPRREFEVKFNPIDEPRSYFELWLHRFGSDEFMLPLYHDTARLGAAVVAGDASLPFDTSYREFVAGGLAVVLGDDPFDFDVVDVVNVDSTFLSISGLTKAWPKGATVHPLRRARLDQESALSALTSHVGDATLVFQLNQANDIADEGTWPSLFNSHPILTAKPNRRETIDLNFERNSLVLDNDHGLRELGDDAGRAFTAQSHMTMQRGRADHWAFRQFLYRLRGRQGAIWIPTYNRDLCVAQPYTLGDPALAIKKIGYELTGGAVSGRRFVLFADGSTAEISDVGAPPTADSESLVLSGPLGADIAAGTFGSFMDTCRLASDDIEITHHTDTDGVSECNLAFRSFRDERVIPNPIYFPLPDADKNETLCGTPAEAGCVPGFPNEFNDDNNDGIDDDPADGGGGGDDDPIPGDYDYSAFLAINLTHYPYGESDLPHTGPEVGDEHIISGPTLTPGDIAGWTAMKRDLMVQSPGVTRPWINRDFPPLAAIDGPHSHAIFSIPGIFDTFGGLPEYPLPDSNPAGPETWANMPWPISYQISLKWTTDGTSDMWQKLYVLSVEDPAAFIAANGGPYHETVEYWDTLGQTSGSTPQIKKVTGYGCVVGFGEASLEHAWLADDISPVYGYGWYQVIFFNFVKYCPRIGFVE